MLERPKYPSAVQADFALFVEESKRRSHSILGSESVRLISIP